MRPIRALVGASLILAGAIAFGQSCALPSFDQVDYDPNEEDGGGGGSGASVCEELAAGDPCTQCLCGVCETEVTLCFVDPDCTPIIDCVNSTNCLAGMDPAACYMDDTCKGVIDASGGIEGVTVQLAIQTVTCFIATGAAACTICQGGGCDPAGCSTGHLTDMVDFIDYEFAACCAADGQCGLQLDSFNPFFPDADDRCFVPGDYLPGLMCLPLFNPPPAFAEPRLEGCKAHGECGYLAPGLDLCVPQHFIPPDGT